MIWSWLQLIWHFLFGWAGIDMLIGFACVAVAVLTPPAITVFIPDLRKWAVYGAVVAFTLTGAIAYGYKNGSDEMRRQWDAALVREFDTGEKILRDSVRDARSDTPERMRNDRWNRDNWKDGRRP